MHRAVRRILKVQPLGGMFCAGTANIGLTSISRRASRYAKYVPQKVELKFEGERGNHGVCMLSANGNDHIVRSLWVGGLANYEAPLPRLYMRAVRGAKVVLDVGANSGLYAVLGATAETNCRVFSFEPLPDALKWLRANLEENHLTDRVTVVEAAAGDQNGTADLWLPEKWYGDVLETSASLNGGFRKRHAGKITVKVVTLDNYVRDAGIERVSILRADVEGAEHLMLKGAGEILRLHRPLVFLEVLPGNAAGLLEPFRAQADYRAVSLSPDELVELPHVQCIGDHYNQLWYPPERRAEVEAIAADLNMPFRVA
jgi:FkbM family methyltransferase